MTLFIKQLFKEGAKSGRKPLYVSWIHDHRGDFNIAVQNSLGSKVQIDWSDVRVICIAPNYTKYDLHAVQVIGTSIELWKYRLLQNFTLYLEEVFNRSVSMSADIPVSQKNPVMVAAGKKAALTRSTAVYTFDEHLEGKSETVKELILNLREFIMELDPAMEEVPKKFHVAYKISQNIVCLTPAKSKVTIYIKLNPKGIETIPANGRDVTEIGHYGTGDFELTITSEEELEQAKEYIIQAYRKIGG